MKIDMMKIIVPPEIIGHGYRRVDTNTEAWKPGDEWLDTSSGWKEDRNGSCWGEVIIRRKVEPKKVWTEQDIACCAEIRSKDLPADLIEEAVQRVVDLFNSDDTRFYNCSLQSREDGAKAILCEAFGWDVEGDFVFWDKINRSPTKPSGKWVECEVYATGDGLFEAKASALRPLTLTSLPSRKGFGGYRYGDEITTSLRFDERGVLMKPDAVRFWEEGR